MNQEPGNVQEHGEVASTPSVLRLLNDCSAQLALLLNDLRSLTDAEPALRALAAQVLQAIELDADIALASILLNRITGTYPVRHCIETALVATLVARAMQNDNTQTLVIAAAALTMNVAMLAQHDSFQSQRLALTRAELAAVQRHPKDGAELLYHAGVRDQAWLDDVLQHHEQDDGSGYPEGLSGAQIAPGARLIGLADRYCALVSARNYRRSMQPDLALRTLLSPEAGVTAELARHFSAELGPYPPGALVRLSNGDVGVVTRRPGLQHCIGVHVLVAHALEAGLKAELEADAGKDGDLPAVAPAAQIAEALHEDEVPLRFGMQQIWGALARL
jgi:HD-GYP domain-containing protein (c-di-GMP phosphodiesterase class II)